MIGRPGIVAERLRFGPCLRNVRHVDLIFIRPQQSIICDNVFEVEMNRFQFDDHEEHVVIDFDKKKSDHLMTARDQNWSKTPGKPIAAALPLVHPYQTCGAVWVVGLGIRLDWMQFWKSHPLVVASTVRVMRQQLIVIDPETRTMSQRLELKYCSSKPVCLSSMVADSESGPVSFRQVDYCATTVTVLL